MRADSKKGLPKPYFDSVALILCRLHSYVVLYFMFRIKDLG
jgi:hypothetical protein